MGAAVSARLLGRPTPPPGGPLLVREIVRIRLINR
eukprot:CAMPEP_0173210412 /NCGR_PEP_ID=MMETSP1141-20130122/23645_1 /TAXON_ID=483371 /ORGANISM="non described non described, Strain CCMP2298" /LENGTH=34 /DNA_ID= /DNA_START= /DNA_END= /DNA_ORIENTATION=